MLVKNLGGDIENNTRNFVEGVRDLKVTLDVTWNDANCKSAIDAV